MTPDLARIASQFLARVDIKGGEALAMVAVLQALDAIAVQTAPVPQREPQAATLARWPRPTGEGDS